MKLLGMFVHEEDHEPVAHSLSEEKVQFTMISSISGLSRKELRTFLIILEEDRIDAVVEVFREHCSEREVGAPGSMVEGLELEEFEKVKTGSDPVTIQTGGATGFVLTVDQFLKINEPDLS
ncbi:MAG: cyclic-di-AMP receptor [bacterium]